jgi:hypothetical protein
VLECQERTMAVYTCGGGGWGWGGGKSSRRDRGLHSYIQNRFVKLTPQFQAAAAAWRIQNMPTARAVAAELVGMPAGKPRGTSLRLLLVACWGPDIQSRCV